MQIQIPVPAGVSSATIKQITPLMEAYAAEYPKHQKDAEGNWYKESTKANPSGSIDLAILAPPKCPKDSAKIEVTF